MFKGAELEFEMNDAGVETFIGIDAFYSEVEKIRNRTPLKNVILTSMKDFLPAEACSCHSRKRQNMRSSPFRIPSTLWN